MLPHRHLYALAWTAAGLLWVAGGTRALVRRAQPDGGCAWWAAGALLVACVVAAVVGARLHFVLLSSLVSSASAGDVLRELVTLPGTDGAGLRVTGGLLAALGVLLALARHATQGVLSRAAALDAVVPLAGLAIAVGRLGCFADGCCFGTPCTAPWCLRFPVASPAYWSHVALGRIADDGSPSLPVHPLQLYLGCAGLVAFAASRGLVRATAPPGSAALVFVALLAGSRVLLEPLRESSFGNGVAYEVQVSGGIAVLAIALLAVRARRAQRAATLRSDAS